MPPFSSPAPRPAYPCPDSPCFAALPFTARRPGAHTTSGYRLRVLRVSDLPLHTTLDGRTFEFQLGVTLYDEAYGTFYGNTCYSLTDGFDKARAQVGGESVDW